MQLIITIDAELGDKFDKKNIDALVQDTLVSVPQFYPYGILKQYAETFIEFDEEECEKLLLPKLKSSKKEAVEAIDSIKKMIKYFKYRIKHAEKAIKSYKK